MKKINVGISISFQPDASIWNSGLNQNLAFLAMLLGKSPDVGKVYLLNAGTEQNLPQGFGFEGIDATLVSPRDVTFDLDLVIEFGASLPLEWVRHVRTLGTKIVVILVGHTYTGQAETPLFGGSGGTVFIGTPWHEIWTLPHHMKTSGPRLRTTGRVPVKDVPHIWSPMFLDRQIAELGPRGLQFGVEHRARARTAAPWRIAMFEPNISVVKSCFIPMLVCDSAYRERHEAVGSMMVLNSFHMKEHPTFNAFAAHLDLTRDGKASYEPRIAFVECMAANSIDAVVAHHWECGLNYAYYDALYGGYPLIHNSEFLAADGMGFHYPGFDAIQGGQALLDAWAQPPEFWDDYRSRSLAYLRGLAPDAPANIEAFMQRIRGVMENAP
jgi:hypothetical protein